jgi:transposase
MMGPKQTDQAALFYEFSLERHVPACHLLRAIDRFVDLSGIRSELGPFRPSIDPELLIRILLVGYCHGIRSERRLCEEVHLNLAYRWFFRFGLDGEVPDHSTFSKNRHGRFRDCDLLRKLFETVVRRCMAEGLVDGTAFAVDASLIAADANKQRAVAGTVRYDWEAFARTRRSGREYLDTLDEAAWGAASETVPKFVSRSDPAAQWTGAHKGHAFFAYADNYLIDLKAAIIVDVEATRAIRQAEVSAARTMIARTEDRFGIHPERLAADSAYGSAEMLGSLVDERAIEPHVPVFDKSARETYATNAERSRHHTEDKQRFVVSVVAYDSLPGHQDFIPAILSATGCDLRVRHLAHHDRPAGLRRWRQCQGRQFVGHKGRTADLPDLRQYGCAGGAGRPGVRRAAEHRYAKGGTGL